MKRRVLNAAANKKALRQCSAMTGARAPFRVLCDASFLRVSFDYFRHYRKAGESLSRKELESTLPSLETLFAELFGTSQYFLQTTPESQDDFLSTFHTSHSNTGAKKLKKQQELEEKIFQSAGGVDTRNKPPQNQQKREQPISEKQSAEAKTFLRKFEIIGQRSNTNTATATPDAEEIISKSERRNEHKAVMAALKDIASGKSNSGYNHPLSSYCVATLNHDLKAMIKRGDVDEGALPIPTIRMTFNPWLLWLEVGSLQKCAPTPSSTEIAEEQSNDKPKFKGVANKADRAFLEHLVKESSTLAATVTAREKFLNSGFNKKINTRHPVARPTTKGMKGPVPNANPLAMKKKRQRETIVCSDETNDEASKKHRAEKTSKKQ